MRDVLQGTGVHQRNAAATQGNPAFAAPGLQVLVDDLAGQTEELRELFLGEAELRAAVRGFPAVHARQAQKALRKFRRHGEQRGIFHLLGRPAYALAEQLYQMLRELRVGSQQREERLTLKNHQLRTRHRGSRGASRTAVEHGDLAEGVAGLHDVEKDFFAARAARTDADAAGDDAEQRIARIAAHENNGAFVVAASRGERGHAIDGFLRQTAEQTVPFYERFDVQRHVRSIVFALVCCCVCSTPAFAQYEVEEEKRVWLRALLDVRLVRAGPAPSWTDTGPGKLRYGGKVTADGSFERTTRLTLAQAILEFGATLPWDVRAQAQVNFSHDLADNDQPWLVEAILRKEWGATKNGFGLQTGLMNMPFSLEHTGPGWLPEYTLTASALNSWLWEDLSLAGAEGEWWRITDSGLRLGALVGVGFGPDQFGRLLALRGWAMGDGLSGLNSDLALPGRTDRTEVFDEQDGRPAAYTWLTISDAREIASLKVGYFDNFGDQSEPGVWRTRFSTVGLTLHPHPKIDVLAQYLDGVARVADPMNDSSLRAYYGLVSYHNARHRVSVRYDSFRLHDLDGPPVTTENGHGVTFAWQYQLGLRHRLAAEYVWLDSRRAANGFVNPTPEGWQLSYRFRY